MLKVIIVASPMVRSSAVKLSMTAEGLAGESAPFGYFDPLGLSDGKSIGDVRVNDNTTYRQNLTLHKTYW
jgi:hypothetical protein